MKKGISLVLTLVLLLAMLSGCSGKAKTYETPEAVVESFMDALKNQDVEAMLACCYTEPYLENMDFEDRIDQAGGFSMAMLASTDYAYYKELMRYRLEGSFANHIQILTFSLVLGEDYEDLLNQMPVSADGKWAREFNEDTDPEALSTLEVLEMLDPLKSVDKRRFSDSAEDSVGAEDAAERLVVFEVDGDMYWKGLSLVEYDGCWYIRNIGSMFAGDIYGSAERLEDKAALKELKQKYS